MNITIYRSMNPSVKQSVDRGSASMPQGRTVLLMAQCDCCNTPIYLYLYELFIEGVKKLNICQDFNPLKSKIQLKSCYK